MAARREYDDDDGRVIADMSDIGRTPMMIPGFSNMKKGRQADNRREQEGASSTSNEQFFADKEARGAMIKGVLAAYLVVGVVIAAAFAGLIILINVIGH